MVGLRRALDAGLAVVSPAPEGESAAGPAAAAAAYLLRILFHRDGDGIDLSLDHLELEKLDDALTRAVAAPSRCRFFARDPRNIRAAPPRRGRDPPLVTAQALKRAGACGLEVPVFERTLINDTGVGWAKVNESPLPPIPSSRNAPGHGLPPPRAWGS